MATPWEDQEDEQERLAGEEARHIGGQATEQDEEVDPAWKAVLEAGGGESEGWEQAEEDLIKHATHGDDRSDTVILQEAGQPEQESNRSTADYAEADQTPSGD
jgi:hypothetical protein